MRPLIRILVLLLFGAPAPSLAYDLYASDGFSMGFLSPFSDYSHILGMLAIGLLAMKTGAAGWFALPTVFSGFMLFGATIGILDVPMIWVEHGVALSVVVFGAALLFDRDLPLSLIQALVGIFALFHGHAYGAEIPAWASPIWFSLGLVVGCSLLIFFGIAFAWYLGKILSDRQWMRGLGGVVVSLGLISIVIQSAV